MKYTSMFSSVQSLSRVQLFATPWTHQASLSITNSQSLPKPMSVMPSNHLILFRLLLLLPSIFPSIRVFSNESALHIRLPKYWSFSFSISPSNEYSGLISFRMDWKEKKIMVVRISIFIRLLVIVHACVYFLLIVYFLLTISISFSLLFLDL